MKNIWKRKKEIKTNKEAAMLKMEMKLFIDKNELEMEGGEITDWFFARNASHLYNFKPIVLK